MVLIEPLYHTCRKSKYISHISNSDELLRRLESEISNSDEVLRRLESEIINILRILKCTKRTGD